MGPSGAGKSTLLNALMGTASWGVASGKTWVNSRPMPLTRLRSIMGYVPQVGAAEHERMLLGCKLAPACWESFCLSAEGADSDAASWSLTQLRMLFEAKAAAVVCAAAAQAQAFLLAGRSCCRLHAIGSCMIFDAMHPKQHVLVTSSRLYLLCLDKCRENCLYHLGATQAQSIDADVAHKIERRGQPCKLW